MDNLFGLGIVLDFTDRASAGILGIGDLLVGLSKKVIAIGTDFENSRVTLGALYGSQELATQKLDWAMKLAAKTPFNIGPIKNAIVGLKAINVEADKTYKNTAGHAQSLLEYVGDLAALRPDKSMSQILRGVREYLGGDPISLRRTMDINIEDIINRKKAGDVKGRIQDIVDFSDKLAKGLMAKLNGTWNQLVSNIGDQITILFLAIADGGAFDAFKEILVSVFDFLDAIDMNEMREIGKIIADSLDVFIKPLKFLVEMLVSGAKMFKELVKENPAIAKTIVTFMALATVLAVVVGLTANLLMFVAMLGVAVAGIPFVVAGFEVLLPVLGTVLSVALGLVAVFASIYLAWKYDLFNIRTAVMSVFKGIQDIIKKTRYVLGMSVKDMKWALSQLKLEDTFVGKISAFLVKAWIIWDAFITAILNDMTISEDQFKTLYALGLLPIIGVLLDLYRYAKSFFGGFIQGTKDIIVWVWGVLRPVFLWLLDTILDVTEAVMDYFGMDTSMFDENVKLWERIGYVVGTLVALLALVVLGVGAVGIAFGLLSLAPIVLKVLAIAGAIFIVVKAIRSLIKWWDQLTNKRAMIATEGTYNNPQYDSFVKSLDIKDSVTLNTLPKSPVLPADSPFQPKSPNAYAPTSAVGNKESNVDKSITIEKDAINISLASGGVEGAKELVDELSKEIAKKFELNNTFDFGLDTP